MAWAQHLDSIAERVSLMWTTVGTGTGTCLKTKFIVKFELELNQERIIVEIGLELELQSTLALEPKRRKAEKAT